MLIVQRTGKIYEEMKVALLHERTPNKTNSANAKSRAADFRR